jgi:hypothetical protein
MGVLLSSALLIYFLWPSGNWYARRQLRAELMSPSGSPDEKLERLEPFVKIGDHIDAVRKKLTDPPASDTKGVDGNTFWSLGLDGVNLELAIAANGRVVGIGRDIWGKENEPEWYTPVWWPEHAANAH